jgi:hypothetical protein
MGVLRADGFDINAVTGVANYDEGAVFAQLWCDATVGIAVGDWVAVYYGSTSNPGAIDGETYRIADADNVGAAVDTVGVAMQALTVGSAANFIQVQIGGYCPVANVDSAGGPPPTIVDGTPLCISATGGRATTNVLDASTTANRRTIGTCRSVPAANLAAVSINRHPRFTTT